MDQDNEILTSLPHLTTPPNPNTRTANLHGPKISFLDFPWEIRNQIYTCALTLAHPVQPYDPSGMTYPTGSNPYHPPLGASTITLLLLNTQIHEEARLILYGQNSFSFSLPSHLTGFDRVIGSKNATLVRRIEVRAVMWTWHVEKNWEDAFKGLRTPGLWGMQSVVVVMMYKGIDGWEERIEFTGVVDLLGDWMRKGIKIDC